jgi:hypothetical protein
MGKTTWTYNALGRLTEVDYPYAKVVTYSYLARVYLWAEVRGRKITMGLSGVGLTTFAYDSRWRLRTILNPYSETTTYSYDSRSLT